MISYAIFSMISYIFDITCLYHNMISYEYLGVLSSEPMPRQIKGIASRLGPPIEELTLPLNAPEGAQVAMRTRDQVVV
jgi:hypothetical protein